MKVKFKYKYQGAVRRIGERGLKNTKNKCRVVNICSDFNEKVAQR